MAKLKNRSWLLFISTLLLIAGCAGVTKQPSSRTPDVISQEAGEGTIVEPAPKPPISGNKAVIALLDRARLDTEAGQREAAGASLERALRIEPRNAWLWHELAQLRLAQGQYAQAIALARKSITFAGRERSLQALNWRLIGNARVAQGDSTKADQAFQRAGELER